MKIEKLENMGQVEGLQEGDVIPMCDTSNYIEGHFRGMLLRHEEGNMTFMGKSILDTYFKWLIKNPLHIGQVRDSQYFFNGFKHGEIESIKDTELIRKYEEATA